MPFSAPPAELVEAGVESLRKEGFRMKFSADHPLNKDRPPPRLTITTTTGKTLLPIESGSPFFGIWNVLLMMPWLNKLGRLPSSADLLGGNHVP
jgi:hypothetical protein